MSHGDGRAGTGLGVFRDAGARHIAPNRHHRVADKFVQRPVVVENRGRHATEIFVELGHEFLRIRLFGQGGEPDDVREQDRRR